MGVHQKRPTPSSPAHRIDRTRNQRNLRISRKEGEPAMSISALNWAFEQDLPHSEKSVLVALAHRADKNGYCYPGIEMIATMTGASRRTVIRAIQGLDEKKLITRERRHRSNGSRTSTSYTLNLSATMTHSPGANVTPSEHEPKCHYDTPVSATVTPPPDKSVLISQIVPAEPEEK